QGYPSATKLMPLVVFGTRATSVGCALMRRAAVTRTSSSRRAHWLQAVSPCSVACCSQDWMAFRVGPGSGATAAWSKYATRWAMGMAARKSSAACATADLLLDSSDTEFWAGELGTTFLGYRQRRS